MLLMAAIVLCWSQIQSEVKVSLLRRYEFEIQSATLLFGALSWESSGSLRWCLLHTKDWDRILLANLECTIYCRDRDLRTCLRGLGKIRGWMRPGHRFPFQMSEINLQCMFSWFGIRSLPRGLVTCLSIPWDDQRPTFFLRLSISWLAR